MRLFILATLAALAACSDHQVQVACAVDGVVQPIAAGTMAVAVPASAPAVSVDSLLVHPAIVAYCAKLGGAPIAP